MPRMTKRVVALSNGASQTKPNGHDIRGIAIHYDGPPAKPELIIKGCAHMKRFSEKGLPEEGTEPLWKACIGVLAFCENADGFAHSWSSKDPRYDASQTQAKLDERRKNQTGASLCSQFHSISTKCAAVCEACPHWGNINSPIALGIGLSNDAKALLEGLVEKTKSDPGAAFTPEALEGLAAFENIRAKLKQAGCRVAELEDALAAERNDGGGLSQVVRYSISQKTPNCFTHLTVLATPIFTSKAIARHGRSAVKDFGGG